MRLLQSERLNTHPQEGLSRTGLRSGWLSKRRKRVNSSPGKVSLSSPLLVTLVCIEDAVGVVLLRADTICQVLGLRWRARSRSNSQLRFLEYMLNTTDKGYSVIITMPNKMSLVSTSSRLRHSHTELEITSLRRKRPLCALLERRLSAHRRKQRGTPQNHT